MYLQSDHVALFQRRLDVEAELGHLDAFLSPWYRAAERWRARKQIAALVAQRQCLRIEISTARAVPEILNQLVWNAARDIRTAEPEQTRNPFHPEILRSIGDLAAEAVERARGARLVAPNGVSELLIAEIPEIARQLTAETVAVMIHGYVDTASHIANDLELLHEWVSDDKVIVQHRASGLRASFHAGADGFGTIFAKPYNIGSIDRLDRGEHLYDWERFTGLGIGRRIYLAGADLLPQQRWARGITTPGSEAVRRKLHDDDPWRWQVSGCSCSADWREADYLSFAGHRP